MRIFEPEFMATTVAAGALAGQYTWYDDGFAGSMRLVVDDAVTLSGRYRSYRFGTTHRVSAALVGPALEVDIHDFNGLAAQRFTGYPAPTPAPVATLLAGVTEWRDERYGFYARRGVPRALPAFRTGDTTPDDFAGTFILRCGGGPVRLDVRHDGDRRLTGRCQSVDGERREVTGAVDPTDPLLVRLALDGGRFTGHLFSRPKNVVAGRLDGPNGAAGAYLVRVR